MSTPSATVGPEVAAGFPSPVAPPVEGAAQVGAPGWAARARAAAARAGRWLWSSRRADLSLRWRLTIWYTVVLALTLGVFSLLVYWWLGNSMMRDVDALSRERALQVEERLIRYAREQQATLLGLLAPAQTIQLRQQGVLVDSLDPFQTPGVGVRVWNSHVQVIDGSPELVGTPRLMDYQPIVLALRGNVHKYILETEEGRFYSYSLPTMFSGGHPLAVIQILTSLQSYDRAMDRLAQLLLAGTLLVTGLAFVTGAALARTALRSIDTITLTAQRINRAQDLGRRIPVKGPRDEIGRLTETVNEMLDRIEGMFERQRQFMADVSHELRTPLTTIRGEVDLMERSRRLDPEGLDAVRDEAERMSRLVGDLLLLSRADGQLDIIHEPVALEEVALDVYRQARRLGGDDRPVALSHVDPCVVLGDRDRLKQLLLNLVHNALIHTPTGTRVDLSLHRDTGAARLVVSDTGQGIPPADLEHIFERFYRVDKARSRSRGGTGLGLAIVDWITDAHGGTVTVDSRPGRGTTFTVRLPLAEDPPA